MRKFRFLVALVAAVVLGVCAALPRGAPSVQPVQAESQHRIYFAVSAVNVDLFNLPQAPQQSHATGKLVRRNRICNGHTFELWALIDCDNSLIETLSCTEELCGSFEGKWVMVGFTNHMDCPVGSDRFAAMIVEDITGDLNDPCPPITTATATPSPASTSATSTPGTPQVTPPDNTPTPGTTPVRKKLAFVCDGQLTQQIADLLGVPVSHLVQTGQATYEDDELVRDGCKWQIKRKPNEPIKVPVVLQVTVTHDYEGEPVVAYYGKDGMTLSDVIDATVRLLTYYKANGLRTAWALDPCQLMAHEQSFGRNQNPAYDTLDGNVGCATYPHKLLQIAGCPKSPAEATKIGGRERDWKFIGFTPWRPYWAWVFKSEDDGGRLEDLRYPGYGDFDFWDQSRFPSPWKGNIPKAGSATFNCR